MNICMFNAIFINQACGKHLLYGLHAGDTAYKKQQNFLPCSLVGKTNYSKISKVYTDKHYVKLKYRKKIPENIGKSYILNKKSGDFNLTHVIWI